MNSLYIKLNLGLSKQVFAASFSFCFIISRSYVAIALPKLFGDIKLAAIFDQAQHSYLFQLSIETRTKEQL